MPLFYQLLLLCFATLGLRAMLNPEEEKESSSADTGSYPLPINKKLTTHSKQLELERMFLEQVEPGNSPPNSFTLKLKELLMNDNLDLGSVGSDELFSMVEKGKAVAQPKPPRPVSSKQLYNLQKGKQTAALEQSKKQSSQISLEQMEAALMGSKQRTLNLNKHEKISSIELMKTAKKQNLVGQEKGPSNKLSSSQLDALLTEGPSILSAKGRSQSMRLTDERKPSGKKDGKISSSFLASLFKDKDNKKKGGSR